MSSTTQALGVERIVLDIMLYFTGGEIAGTRILMGVYMTWVHDGKHWLGNVYKIMRRVKSSSPVYVDVETRRVDGNADILSHPGP